MVLLALGACGDRRGGSVGPSEGEISIEPVGGVRLVALELDWPQRMASSGRGSYYMATRSTDGMIVEVDSVSGEVIRTIGGIGDGPGEYRSVGLLLHRAGNLLVQNPQDGRFFVYGPDGSFSRWFTTDVPVQMGDGLVLRGDTMVLAEPISNRDAFGLPMHLVTRDGIRVRSFGSDDRTVDPQFITPQLRLLAPNSDSSFWVGRRDRYRIELWNTAGVMERALEPEREWFPRMVADPGDPAIVRPTTQMLGISRDVHGHLLVLIIRAPEDWKAVKPVDGQSDPPEWITRYELVVEVLDEETGVLMSSGTRQAMRTSGRFLGNGLLQGYGDAGDGASYPSLWRIQHVYQ